MNDTPTIKDLMPPKARAWIYAALRAVDGGYVVAEIMYDVPVPVLIVLGVVNAAGFTLAKGNTPSRLIGQR